MKVEPLQGKMTPGGLVLVDAFHLESSVLRLFLATGRAYSEDDRILYVQDPNTGVIAGATYDGLAGKLRRHEGTRVEEPATRSSFLEVKNFSRPVPPKLLDELLRSAKADHPELSLFAGFPDGGYDPATTERLIGILGKDIKSDLNATADDIYRYLEGMGLKYNLKREYTQDQMPVVAVELAYDNTIIPVRITAFGSEEELRKAGYYDTATLIADRGATTEILVYSPEEHAKLFPIQSIRTFNTYDPRVLKQIAEQYAAMVAGWEAHLNYGLQVASVEGTPDFAGMYGIEQKPPKKPKQEEKIDLIVDPNNFGSVYEAHKRDPKRKAHVPDTGEPTLTPEEYRERLELYKSRLPGNSADPIGAIKGVEGTSKTTFNLF